MKLSMSEVLAKVDAVANKEERIKFARANFDPATLKLIKYAYDPAAKWVLPQGAPPFKPCPFDNQEQNLRKEVRKLYMFLEGGSPNLKKLRREYLFVQVLETLTPGDAALLIAAKDKKLPYKRLDKKFILEAFPGLF